MIKRIANHLMVVLAIALVVMMILDEFNPVMGFLTSNISKIYLGILAVCVLFVGYANIVEAYRRSRGKRRRLRHDGLATEQTEQE